MSKNQLLNPKVDDFLRTAKKWQEELTELRRLILTCPLTEELKWKQPCYTFQKKNIVLIGGFKDYCVLSFFKGALLQDVHNILKKPGENTQVARLIRFTNTTIISEMEPILKSYIEEAIEVEKSGLIVETQKKPELNIPDELQRKFDESPALNTAFTALTPGRQRAYLLYFSAAKQPKTRESRIEKYRKRILDGFGLNDCTCGLSKKMPYCDGSHNRVR